MKVTKTNFPNWLKLLKGSIEQDDDEAVDVLLAEPIGETFDKETWQKSGVSSKAFGDSLNQIPRKKPVNLLINTLGGRVDEGVAMHNMILARGNVTTCVIGFAASMGAVIFQGGSTRKMMPGTSLVFHNPQNSSQGDYRDMENSAVVLKQMKDNLVSIISARSGLSNKRVSDLMDTLPFASFGPEDALELGLCDEIIQHPDAWNDLAIVKASNVYNFVNAQKQVPKMEIVNDAQTLKQQQKKMKLTDALARLKVISSADLNDDEATIQAEKYLNSLAEKNKRYEDETKKRIESLVDSVIKDGLVKESRKAFLIEIGISNEVNLSEIINDLNEVRLDSQKKIVVNKVNHGAAPVPKENGSNDGEDVDSQIKNLVNSMKDQNLSERTETIKKLAKLRGRENLFAEKK